MEIYTKTLPDGREQLLRSFTAHGVTVPSGFVFDGASAPRIFWSIIPPFKRTKKASCIHDYLCRNAKSKEDRKRADEIFYRMLQESGISETRCKIGYLGVRIGAFFGAGVYY